MNTSREDSLLKTAGRNVRSFRLKARLTQEETAARSDIDVKHLQKIEAGGINVTIRSLARIAATLKTSPERLLRGR